MKKLFFLLILAAVVYGAWKYMQAVNEKAETRAPALKQSEKALKEMDRPRP